MSAPASTAAVPDSVFAQTYLPLPTPDDANLARWGRVLALRDTVNKAIEARRAAGELGASLQAAITLTLPADDWALCQAMGPDLKYLFIVSRVTLQAGNEVAVQVDLAPGTKCERCWHYTDDVGQHGHEGVCGRCVSNLHGDGESRGVA